ncbi:hypothetical protein MUP77_01285 [Candidatus Bathyarchaeota archaeon]|nr:hypothetical protein [Candidatus Bathyarchaeota archaeon]
MDSLRLKLFLEVQYDAAANTCHWRLLVIEYFELTGKSGFTEHKDSSFNIARATLE